MILIGLTVRNQKELPEDEANIFINPSFLAMFMRDDKQDITSVVISGCNAFAVVEHPDLIALLVKLATDNYSFVIPAKFNKLTIGNMDSFQKYIDSFRKPSEG